MTRRPARSLRLRVSVLLNVLALAYLLLLFRQRLPAALGPKPICPQTAYSAATAAPSPKPACPVCPEAPPPPAAASSPAAALSTPPHIARYALCEHASVPAAVRGLHLRAGDDDLLAVHCGDSVDLLGFDPAGPRRIAHLEKRASDPKLRWEAAPIVAADIDADGVGDLLVGFAATDATGGPHGGALVELVSTQDGGFAAPRLLAPVYVAGLTAGRLDARDGADIVVLRREDTRLGQTNQVIALHGGPSPLKMFSAKAPDDARSVTAIDLDLDGRDELLLSAQSAPPEVMYLGAQGELVRRAALPLPAASAVLVADLDGDGAPDAVFSGDKLSVVLASHEHPEQVQVLADASTPSQLAALDVNQDGKLDLVWTSANTVFAYIQSAPLHFETMKIATFPASEFILDGLVALSASKPRLVVLRRDTAQPTHSEFVIVPLDSAAQPLHLDPQSTQPVDSPLRLRITLF
jgi:hypothetical protein